MQQDDKKQQQASAFPMAEMASYIFNYSGNAFLVGFGVGALKGSLSKKPLPSTMPSLPTDSKLQGKHFRMAQVFHNSFKYAFNSLVLVSVFTTVDSCLAKFSDFDPQQNFVWWHKAVAGASTGMLFSLASFRDLGHERVKLLLGTTTLSAIAGVVVGALIVLNKTKVEPLVLEQEAKRKALKLKQQDEDMEGKIQIISAQAKVAQDQMQKLMNKE